MTRYLNAGAVLSVNNTDLFVCPENNQAIIHSLYCSTNNELQPSTVTIEVYDASAGKIYLLGNKLEVLPRATLVFEKQINLESNDILRVRSSTENEVNVFASIMAIVPASL